MARHTRRPTPRPPVPETLRDQVVLEEHDLAPDGSFAVVSRRVVEGEDYTSSLWLVPVPRDGGGRLPPPAPPDARSRPRRPAGHLAGRPARGVHAGLPGDDDAPASLGILDLTRRRTRDPAHRRAVGARVRVVAGRPADRVHRQDGPAAVHRRAGAEDGRAACAPRDRDGLPLGRDRLHRQGDGRCTWSRPRGTDRRAA